VSRTRPALRAEALEDRLAPAAGDLDPSFGHGAAVATAAEVNDNQLIALPDGGSVVLTGGGGGAPTTAIVRYNADGTPDIAFAGGEFHVPLGIGVLAIAAQPDGRILYTGLVIGGGGSGPTNDFVVTRLTTGGQPDPTFGTNGTATVGFNGGPGTRDVASALAVAPDGRIVVGGQIGGLPEVPRLFNPGIEFGAARLTPDGKLDPTFGTGGMVAVPFPVGDLNFAAAKAVAVQPDGSVILAGSAAVDAAPFNVNGFSGANAVTELAAVRLRDDGQLDSGFANGGRLLVPFDPSAKGSDSFQKADVRPDGRILLAGQAFVTTGPTRSFIGVGVRLTPDGQLDPAYGKNGVAADSQTLVQFAVEYGAGIGPDGQIAFVGTVASRLTPDGRPDLRFGPNGMAQLGTINVGTGMPQFIAVAVQPDGNVLVGAEVRTASGSLAGGLVARLLGNGPPDGFVPSTTGTIQIGGSTDGKVVVLSPDAGGQYKLNPQPPFFPTMTAFPLATQNVRVATADVNGDGTPDYIDAAGPGAAPDVVVFDGKTGNVLAEFLAFEGSFTGGVFVAAGDLNGDGRAEIVVTPDQGGGPNVVTFSLNADGSLAAPKAFFALGNPAFRGGARAAIGDVNGDGVPDVAVGAGFLGGPNVEIHDGKALAAGDYSTLIGSGFFAFDGPDATTLRNGVFLAAGDVNGDGFADLIAGGGPGGGPRVLILSGKKLSAGDVAGAYAAPVANFFFGSDASRGGVRVATTNADGDKKADLVVGSGEGLASTVRVYLGKDFIGTGEPAQFQDLDPFGAALPGGVFVG
jgi:uncharacterized delta-60 repeat protein